jgi:cytochrome b561
MNTSSAVEPVRPLHYTSVAIALHWLLGFAILGTLAFGVYMTDLPFSPGRVKQYNWHKWAGITILLLSALRLLWRLTHKPPPLLSEVKSWEKGLAHATHYGLYALFFVTPLMGWAYSNAAGFPVVYLGLVPLPDLVGKEQELAATLKLIHKICAFSMAGLVLLHILGALKHTLTGDQGVIYRMLPGPSK